MSENLGNVLQEILKERDIDTVYLYGSYVNGYYQEDSDIDVVAVFKNQPEKSGIDYPPNISVHNVPARGLSFFETGRSYAHLRMVPLYNEDKCEQISDEIKLELVRRELIRFKRSGITNLNTLDPIHNFLLGYGVERPWRIKPIKRIFASEETQEILKEEYERIFKLVEGKGMVERMGEDNYEINKDYLFDEKTGPAKVKEGLEFKLRNSYGGWHYLKNFPTLLDFAKKRI